MTQVDQQELERLTLLGRAALIIDTFLKDRTSYPDDDFRLRRGICKALLEEYMPLVLLAKAVPGVQSVRLFSASNKGPDGEIRFSDQLSWRVQITCAHEDYQRGLMREQLQQDGMAAGGKRHRDTIGHVVCEPSVFVADDEVEARVKRIRSAVQAKEHNFHKGTDTLIVLEAPAGVRYLRERSLHARVLKALQEGPSNYERIYVIYGTDVKRARETQEPIGSPN